MTEWEIRGGDCLDLMKELSADSVDLIMTSPPYADQRKSTYGGIHPDKYVEWWKPIAIEMQRVLKPTGTLIVNIKEKVVAGERHIYVMDMIRSMRESGWLWTEEYIWHKRNCTPGKWPNRFRDSFERCLHFNCQRKFTMYQDAVREPVGNWAAKRMDKLSDNDRQRTESAVGSGFGRNVSNWAGRDTVYPTNVLHMATECSNVGHSAAYPVGLPKWFIKLFTQAGDLVLDPFSGSGTTGVAAIQEGRRYLGMEKSAEYLRVSRSRLDTGCIPPPPRDPNIEEDENPLGYIGILFGDDD